MNTHQVRITRPGIARRDSLARTIAAIAITVTALAVSCPPASGLTIQRNPVAPGASFPGGTAATSASTGMVGGGNLTDVFHAAADLWEAAILDDHTVNVHFGWADLRSGVSGTTRTTTTLALPQRVVSAEMLLSDSIAFFADPTPGEHDEYTTVSRPTADLGGGELTVGHTLSGARGDAAGRLDLLTIVLHEMGHALGMTGLLQHSTDVDDGDIDVTAPRPFPGTAIPMDDTLHTTASELPNSLMRATFPASGGFRILPSHADMLAVAEASHFENVVIPEPTALAAASLGVVAVGRIRRRGFGDLVIW